MNATINTTTELTARLKTDFSFEVQKFPLYGPDNAPTPMYGLFRDDMTGIESYVGNPVRRGYVPHTTDDVIAMTEVAHEAFQGVPIEIMTSWNEGHQVSIRPTLDYRETIFNEKDSIFPMFNLSAGYDGRAFNPSLGYYRDACRNMTVIRGTDRKAGSKIRHTFGLRGKMDELLIQFRQVIHEWEETVEAARTMQSTEVSVKSFMVSMFPRVEDRDGAARTNAENRIAAIIKRIASERVFLGVAIGDLESATAWELFNGVQGWVQHDKARRSKPSDYQRALMSTKDDDVAKALQLCLAS